MLLGLVALADQVMLTSSLELGIPDVIVISAPEALAPLGVSDIVQGVDVGDARERQMILPPTAKIPEERFDMA